MTQHVELRRETKAHEPVIDVDTELKRFEAGERARLGIEAEERWIETMANLSFKKSEKAKITLLVGGLTKAQDYLVEAALRHLGYETICLDAPDNEALQYGKEFGNRAQCNPTYFTVGNLVKFLSRLRDEKGMSTKEVVDKFVFLTAGACGPCRFGMYVTEYRKALRDAGFDGFRVQLFQQQGGLSQATGDEAGLELTPPFFLGIVKALVAGDVLNGVGYRLRPYEKVPGATDRALSQAKKICYDALLEGRSILVALLRAKRLFLDVEVDRLQPKPKVAIIGEFWAMTTEGDGNYGLQRFIEAEGGECDIQFVTAWLLYNVWEVAFDTKNRAELRGMDGGVRGLKGSGEIDVFKKQIALWAADKAIRVGFHTFAACAGFYDYKLPDMEEVARVAAPYYDNDLRGGEGHMEVGKLILNVAHQKATMTLSVKPFGCMPSSGVSDGVQSLITERYPGSIFCAVETSGDGAVNFYSRVQMYLFKARQAAVREFEQALKETGLTLEKARELLAKHPVHGSPLHRSPHRASITSADLVYELGELASSTATERAWRGVKKTGAGLVETAKTAWKGAPEATRAATRWLRAASAELFEIAREQAPGAAEKVRQSAARVVKMPMRRVEVPVAAE
jgi:predicted nucleotide-binding protein (sugar kinase/HSP70/actin superfamily)